jgi:hypothetical protein
MTRDYLKIEPAKEMMLNNKTYEDRALDLGPLVQKIDRKLGRARDNVVLDQLANRRIDLERVRLSGDSRALAPIRAHGGVPE